MTYSKHMNDLSFDDLPADVEGRGYESLSKHFEADADHSDVVEVRTEVGGDLIHFGVTQTMEHNGQTFTWKQPTDERLRDDLVDDVDKTWTIDG